MGCTASMLQVQKVLIHDEGLLVKATEDYLANSLVLLFLFVFVLGAFEERLALEKT